MGHVPALPSARQARVSSGVCDYDSSTRVKRHFQSRVMSHRPGSTPLDARRGMAFRLRRVRLRAMMIRRPDAARERWATCARYEKEARAAEDAKRVPVDVSEPQRLKARRAVTAARERDADRAKRAILACETSEMAKNAYLERRGKSIEFGQWFLDTRRGAARRLSESVQMGSKWNTPLTGTTAK